MWWTNTLVFSAILRIACCNRKFPPGFKFGAATAAYQVEGAWNISDKSESIWDVFTHNHPEAIIDQSNGDVACDSYHQWRRDVEIASELGLHFYRFSIAWTRLLPNGFSNHVSDDGKKYYSDLIDALLEKGIEPVVTLYHWDLPQSLQNLGGWTNPLIADWFGEYARVAYSLYADRVKTWLTINEPVVYCQVSYGSGMHAPGIISPDLGSLMCSKNAVLAHAKAWRIYDEEFRPKYQGKVSLTNQLMWFEPDDDDEQESADLCRQLWTGVFTHPIYSKEGGWPPALEKKIAEKSKQQGYKVSKLPPFTQEEKELARGTYDFFGFNFYTARTARKAKAGEEVGPWPFTGAPNLEVVLSVRPDWKPAAIQWFFLYPKALRLQLSWVKHQYGDVDIFILENGVAGYDKDLNDQDRVDFYKDHLEQVLLSIKEDGVKVVGYTAWTMIDNYEWSDGYRSKFGLYAVDFEDANRARTPRASAQYYARVIRQHSLDVDVLLSINVDNVSVTGYAAWSLVDDFEWLSGYRPITLKRNETALIQRSWGIDPSFPPYFKFGAATAAYQIEGGWNADGKGENIWDRHVHEHPEDIRNNETGDVAADSYHQWREDVKAVMQMGLQTYRFSISWARILPTGFTNEFNTAGAKYYSDLIDALLAEGIEPIVTLYHWELPVKIQDLGGWTNPLIVKWFGDYARIIYTLYADRVRTWLTVNEPVAICDYFYNLGSFAPGIKESTYAPYLCNKYVMLAHAKAYRIFEHEFRPRYPGRISLANNVLWIEPFSPNDEALAELGRQYQTGRYSHPIFSKKGGWPPSVEKWMLELSLKQGYAESRLPPFTREEIEFMKGTADFYGINFYTAMLIRPSRLEDKPGIWFITGSPELNATLEPPPGAYYGSSPILPVVPKSIRKQLRWLKQQYGDVEILITENGFSSVSRQLDDYDRADFIKEHLEQVLLSIKVDNVNVVGYTVWSLIDNFEWLDGYRTKFGLYDIDFNHPNRTRTPRVSARYYACVATRRSLDVPDSCYNKSYATYASHRIKLKQGNGTISTSGGILLNLIAFIISFTF